MKLHRLLILSAVALVLIVGIIKGLAIPKISPKDAILKQAKVVVLALKEKNLEKIAALTHPDKGIRFSPYGTIQEKDDKVFSRAQIPGLFSDPSVVLWGYYDGSGEPIMKTFAEYFAEFVVDVDFAAAPKISFDERLGQGNTLNNISDAYPNAHVVEFHFPGFDPQYEGMDWKSLRLVFEVVNDQWFLVGVIHVQWTI